MGNSNRIPMHPAPAPSVTGPLARLLIHGLVIGKRSPFQLLPFGPRKTWPKAAVMGLVGVTTGEARRVLGGDFRCGIELNLYE